MARCTWTVGCGTPQRNFLVIQVSSSLPYCLFFGCGVFFIIILTKIYGFGQCKCSITWLLALHDVDVVLKDLGSFFWSLWCLHSSCWKYFWYFPMIQTKVLVASLMIFTVLGCLTIFFLKLPFLELGNHMKISAWGKGSDLHTVSLRQLIALAFSSKTSKF